MRYQHDDIYTYTGSILIAVNPFASMPHLYGLHMMEQYRGRNLGELSPHVYAIADSAYRQMRREKKSQSILVRACSGCNGMNNVVYDIQRKCSEADKGSLRDREGGLWARGGLGGELGHARRAA